MTEWQTGDRVRLKASHAYGYNQPFRGYATRGRPATLTRLRPSMGRRFLLTFDGRGRTPYTLMMDTDSAFERIDNQCAVSA